MTHLDLFSGIGGFALSARNVWGEEYINIGHCEVDKFCCKVYHKHFISPCLGDITKIKWSGIHADLLTGGFPCQPYSTAGNRKGKNDDRALWPEMVKAIRQVKPRWVLAENVDGIISMELDEVLSDLESAGYETQTFVIPACAVGASHRRNRVWIIGNDQKQAVESTIHSSAISENTNSFRWYRQNKTKEKFIFTIERSNLLYESWRQDWFEVAARLCGVDDGIPGRLDRLRALGNAIVPQVAMILMQAIKKQMELQNRKS
jgi:DNA (cytosine-5)-methyltransferase 1